MATKVIFNLVPPFISECSSTEVKGIEYEWFKTFASNIGLTSYTTECVQKTSDEFIAYVSAQTSSLGIGGVFYHDNYYLNYNTVSPVVQSSIEIGIDKTETLSGSTWSVLMSYDLMIVMILLLLFTGGVFWYTEEYIKRVYKLGNRKVTNKDIFHEVFYSIYRMILIFYGNIEKAVRSLEGKYLAAFVSLFSLFLLSQLYAGCIGKQDGLTFGTGGITNYFNREVYVEPTFYQTLVNLGVVSTEVAGTTTTSGYDIFITEENLLRYQNKDKCNYLVLRVPQRINVKTLMVLSSDFSSADITSYKKYSYMMLNPDNQATVTKNVNTFYTDYQDCLYTEKLHVSYANYEQDVVHLAVLIALAVIAWALPLKFLVAEDQTLTVAEKKNELRQINQLRAAKILNVLSSLMDKNYMNINDTTHLLDTCLQYTDKKGQDLIATASDSLTRLQKKTK